ncbi:hypothetical protein FPV67DRAFT_1703736 [Lyophyllum atratum]|nr:hypothetical protein FPV67DRAFT_1703736 [Lyophyllum atratum]
MSMLSRSWPDVLAFFSSRRVLARILSTLLCSIFVVIRPFSKFGGSSAFLALTLKELAFSVQGNLAQQFEVTVFNLASGLIAIGLSSLANYLSSLAQAHGKAVVSRLISALFLAVISFSAGFLKSRLPRLTLPSRVICFVSIWLLTTNAGGTEPIWPQTGHFLWILLTSAVATFLSSLLLLQWSSTQIAYDIASCFSNLRLYLRHYLGEAFEEIPDLLRQSVSLDTVYQQAAFELRIGRVSVKHLKPFIGTIEHLRRELSRGMTFPQHPDSIAPLNDVIKAFYSPALELGCAILDSMSAIEQIVLACFGQSVSLACTRTQEHNLFMARKRLSAALIRARAELRAVCDMAEFGLQSSEGDVDLPLKVLDMCSFMISLLQMAQTMRNALNEAQNILVLYTTSNVRLWYPRFSLAWLGVPPSMMFIEERGLVMDEEIQDVAATSPQEALQGIAEQESPAASATLPKKRATTMENYLPSYASIWNNPRTLAARLLLSRFLKSVEHSPHLRHAFKNAVGIAILSIPAFLPVTSLGYAWFKKNFGQWMLVSFLWVLETNTGATWRVAYLRISGTIVGALYAYVASLICRRNAYALVALVTLSDVPISYVVTRTTFPVPRAVTLPPVMFPPYFSESTRSPGTLAVVRGAMIAAGIVAALLINSVLFPRHCRVLFLNSTCRTLGLFSQLYMGLSRDLLDTRSSLSFTKQRSVQLELNIRQLIHLNTFICDSQRMMYLVQKPMRCYRQIVDVLQRLLDLLTGIRKIRENIPRKETVEEVIPQRREMMSCVCLSFFACEHAFRSRQSLPQFIPSVRDAFRTLEKDVEERIAEAQKETPEPLGLPFVYAFAEINILRDLVEAIEDLLDLTRQLFGTSSWYSGPPVANSSPNEEAGTGQIEL